MNALRNLNFSVLRSHTSFCKRILEPVVNFPKMRMYHSLVKCTASVSLPNPTFLQPIVPTLNAVCGMKTKGRLNRRCKDCYFVMRQGILYIMCPTHPRHKQMLKPKKPRNTWITTHATQGTARPW